MRRTSTGSRLGLGFRKRDGRVYGGVTALAVLTAILIGATVGVGTFTFGYADGASYLTNDPHACANCHVMQEHLDAWHKSSHGKFASCNDCHAPHDAVGKYYCKARNGFFHSLAFTTDQFPTNITMHEYNTGVVEQNCRYCHQAIVDEIDPVAGGQQGHGSGELSCLHCHDDVGHDT